MMQKTTLLFLFFFLFYDAIGQSQYASEIILVNGETFGANASNLATYNLITKDYTIIDSLKTNSVQDLLIEDSIVFIAAQNKLFSYNLITKTKIAEVDYDGVSPSKQSLFIDNNYLYVGNWYGQNDSNVYAYQKTNLNLAFSINEASSECGGGLSLNDTLYIGQKIKGTIDACAPFGCFQDSLGSILVTNANDGSYFRTIALGEEGNGISQIYNNGNFLYAVCNGSNKILKIEIATDSVHLKIDLPDFTQILQQKGTKIYLDLNGNVGYFDMSNDAFALSALAIAGDEMLYDETSETVISTISDYFSYGTLRVYNAIYADTINIGIAPEALGIFYADNSAPNAINDTYNYSYDENTAEYTLDVLANDVDADGGILQISSVSSSAIAGTLLNIVNDKIVYQRVAGVATTDIFTYSVCDEQGICDTAQVTITLKSLTPIQSINDDQFINLHPNPTSAFIQVDSKYEVIDIEIYDLQGKIVKKSKESLISLEDLQKGIYFAHVLDKNNDSFVIKVILK